MQKDVRDIIEVEELIMGEDRKQKRREAIDKLIKGADLESQPLPLRTKSSTLLGEYQPPNSPEAGLQEFKIKDHLYDCPRRLAPIEKRRNELQTEGHFYL